MFLNVLTIQRFGIARFLTQFPNTHAVLLDRGDAAGLSQLKNGFRVATFDNGRPTATIGVWLNAWSKNESASNSGVFALFEGLVPKGSKKRNSMQLQTDLAKLGVHVRPFTSREHSAFFVECLKSDKGFLHATAFQGTPLGLSGRLGFRCFSSVAAAPAETITRKELENVRVGLLGQIDAKMTVVSNTLNSQRAEIVAMLKEYVENKLLTKHDLQAAWSAERFTIVFVFLVGSAVVIVGYYISTLVGKKIDKMEAKVEKMEAKVDSVEEELRNLKHSIDLLASVLKTDLTK